MVPIYRGSDYIEAHLLTGLLRQRGIEVFLQGAMLQGGIGDLPALGHLTIMVDEEDRVAAKRIIAAYERGELQIDEEMTGESDFAGQEESDPTESDNK